MLVHRVLFSVLVLGLIHLALPGAGVAQEPGPDLCFLCETEIDGETGEILWTECDETKGDEEGMENCLDDQLGEYCLVDMFEECEDEPVEEEQLVYLPAAGAGSTTVMAITYRTSCAPANMEYPTVHVVSLR